MSPEEIAAFTATLAIAISKEQSTEEIDTLVIILSQLASTLTTISYQRQLQNPNVDPTDSLIIST